MLQVRSSHLAQQTANHSEPRKTPVQSRSAASVDAILAEVGNVCVTQRGQPVEQMAEALAVAFLAVKMRDPKKSRALYAVSSDVEGAKIVAGAMTRVNNAIVGLLQSA